MVRGKLMRDLKWELNCVTDLVDDSLDGFYCLTLAY